MADSSTGMAAPMAMPMMMGSAIEKSMMPVDASACKMPTAADADCSTQVNSSTYKMVPRSATVGTATSDPQAYEEIMAAISTANIDHVKNVAAALNARAAAAAGQTEIVDD